MTIIFLSFFAWVFTVLAPCVLPLLPIILWASIVENKDRYRPYIIIVSLSISIIIFSLLLKATTLLIGFDKSILTFFSWIIIIFFWVITIFPDLWKNFSTKIWFAWKSNESLWKSSQKKWFLWSILIGFSLWPVFSSCSPTYAIILAVILPLSLGFWLINLFFYVLGLWSILLLISILWQKFTKKLRIISDPKSKFKKILWILFLIIGLFIITWLDKKIESYAIKKWFVWIWNIEQNFLDKVQDDIDNLDNKKWVMKTNEIKKDINDLDTAYFAWGCFWCIESIMDAQNGVYEAFSWYMWWEKDTANYEDVSSWITSHREAVKVIFDSSIISYSELVNLFFRQIDPTDAWWQFADRWFQYTTAIYYVDEKQKVISESIIEKLESSWDFDKPIETVLEDYVDFYEAEEYHQNYSEKQSFRYKMYKNGSWRASYIDENKDLYDKLLIENYIDKEELKQKLTPLEYEVTQNWATEKPFDNKYWDLKDDWIYVDIVDWTPLFSSLDKYDSGSGWPAFTRPIDEALLMEKEDKNLFMTRTEIKSKTTDSHLWHVFDDGPEEEGWLRYCINSAALRFVSLENLEKEWYSKYKILFENN